MLKYEKLGNNNVKIEVLQSQGWLVLGEVVGPEEVYIKLVKVDQDHSNELRSANQLKE